MTTSDWHPGRYINNDVTDATAVPAGYMVNKSNSCLLVNADRRHGRPGYIDESARPPRGSDI